MSKLDDIEEYLRKHLTSWYSGKPNSDDLKEKMAHDVVDLVRTAATKFHSTWKDGLPAVGDFVEARNVSTGLLEPDDINKPLYDSARGTISLLYMMPGTPLLVLATEGRSQGNIRVMSIWSGDTGWIHVDCLRPFEP
jgi:hypothetical protein